MGEISPETTENIFNFLAGLTVAGESRVDECVQYVVERYEISESDAKSIVSKWFNR